MYCDGIKLVAVVTLRTTLRGHEAVPATLALVLDHLDQKEVFILPLIVYKGLNDNYLLAVVSFQIH